MAEGKRHTIALATTVRARMDLLASELSPTEAVMLDLDRGTYFGVDTVGKTIWDALATPKTIADLCRLVEQTYETDSATAQVDTMSFVNELYEGGLVTVEHDDQI